MRSIGFTSTLLAAGICAAAQTGTIAGPSTGLVFDGSAHVLRPIRGVPGAATFGSPVDAGASLSAAWLSPTQDNLFARDAAGQLRYFQIGASGVTQAAIDGISVVPDRVVFSPSGATVALYASGQIQIVTGLPAAPKAAPSFALAHGVRGTRPAITSLAVSDDGAYLAFVAGGSIQLANASEGSRVIGAAGYGASIAFAPGAHDIAVAAPGTGVALIHDAANTATSQALAADDPAYAQIAGVAFSSDGRQVYVGSASANSVISLDATAGTRTDFACSCSLTGLTRMGSAFRLTEFSSGPLWLFDASSNQRVVFVPAWMPTQAGAQ